MPKRVRLRWNRSQDEECKFYRVYRSDTPIISTENIKNEIIMKVEHPSEINPIRIYDEKPTRIDERSYQLEYSSILTTDIKGNEEPFIMEINGYFTDKYLLDTLNGIVIFDEAVPELAQVVAKQYSFDGVEAWDYEIEEGAKTYYGPEAKDTSAPLPPSNLTIDKDLDQNRIILKWSPSKLVGKVYYYTVDSAVDERRYSKLSGKVWASLREPLADRPYLVERSDDGVKWKEIARSKGNQFFEYGVDRQPPTPVRNLSAAWHSNRGTGTYRVILSWEQIRDVSESKTAMFRVRAKNRVGMISNPSEAIGPIDFKLNISHILIRRKIDDGVDPSYDGSDAQTIAIIQNINARTFEELITDKVDYVYGMWVVDTAGNYSTVTTARIEAGDATAPELGTFILAEELHYSVG